MKLSFTKMNKGRFGALWICTALLVGSVNACTFSVPELSAARLSQVCASSRAAACSIWKRCVNPDVKPKLFYSVCNTTRIASTLCLDDADVAGSIPECNGLQAAKAQVVDATSGCAAYMGFYSMRSVSNIIQSHRRNCDAMDGMAMAGCTECTGSSEAECPDPLGAFSVGCVDMLMNGCTSGGWRAFCTSEVGTASNVVGGAAAVLCVRSARWAAINAPPAPPPPEAVTPSPSPLPSPALSPPPPPTPAPSTEMLPAEAAPSPSPLPLPSPSPRIIPQASPSPANCLTSPSLPSCQSFVYAEAQIQLDIDNLCESMPDMVGCSIRNACDAGSVSNAKWCQPMTLLATLCVDMPTMRGCNNYKVLCGASSVVAQCKEFPAIPGAPGSNDALQASLDMCNEMPMTQCATCTAASCPDPLSSLAGMCTDMPGMSRCSLFTNWCSAVAAAGGGMDVFCVAGGGHSSGLPSMLMYFHERISEIVLWHTWVPRTDGEYVGTIICILMFGITSMFLKTASSLLTLWWKARAAAASNPEAELMSLQTAGPYAWLLPRRHQLWQNVVRGVILGVSVTLDYWNMLVAMTFNVGLFCAVIMGYVLGIMLFSHAVDNYAARLAALRRAMPRAAAYKLDPELGRACVGCDGCDAGCGPAPDPSAADGLVGMVMGTDATKGALASASPKSGNELSSSSSPDEDIGCMPTCCPEPR